MPLESLLAPFQAFVSSALLWCYALAAIVTIWGGYGVAAREFSAG
jgi:hypothetical protein